MSVHSALTLSDVRPLLEHDIPMSICTACSKGARTQGPRVLACFVDECHLAVLHKEELEWQGECIRLRHPNLQLFDPRCGASLEILTRYQHTETSGSVMGHFKVRLEAIAWHAGKQPPRLHGVAEFYRVMSVQTVHGNAQLQDTAKRLNLVSRARCLSERLAGCTRKEQLLEALLNGLEQYLEISHAIVWLLDVQQLKLVLLASHGYRETGIGSFLTLDHGLAGIVARAGIPVRINDIPHLSTEREPTDFIECLPVSQLSRICTCPGLVLPTSQLAVPLQVQGCVVGVLFVEDQHDRYFDHSDEDSLTILAAQFSATLAMLGSHETKVATPCSMRDLVKPLEVHYYHCDSSVFLNGEYLIKGVAGSILWKLVRAYVNDGRTEFSTRELRQCASELHLPVPSDNLHGRLLLLQRRLARSEAEIQIRQIGRGRFCLSVQRPLKLCGEVYPKVST